MIDKSSPSTLLRRSTKELALGLFWFVGLIFIHIPSPVLTISQIPAIVSASPPLAGAMIILASALRSILACDMLFSRLSNVLFDSYYFALHIVTSLTYHDNNCQGRSYPPDRLILLGTLSIMIIALVKTALVSTRNSFCMNRTCNTFSSIIKSPTNVL